MLRRVSVLLTVFLACCVLGANAFAVCPKSDWPHYKPTQNDFTADTMLGFIISDAQSHIDANNDAAGWREVLRVATASKANTDSHPGSCLFYWNKVKRAY